MPRRVVVALLLAAVALALAPSAGAMGKPGVAALQVALRAHGLYRADVDGIAGPRTRAAVRAFQRRQGLAVDGIAGPRTRAALGRLGRPRYGSRLMWRGKVGWDVSALQFTLAWHGFPSGAFDGHFGPRTEQALRRYQRWRGIGADGVAGPLTIRTLRAHPPRSPVDVRRPAGGWVSSTFGPRHNRFHAGLDLAAPHGAAVVAARRGVVRRAGHVGGGFGRIVVVRHAYGVSTLYAHLSRVSVWRGQRVRAGRRLGAVGSTGRARGPHLHFEVRVGGAAVDPLRALR